MHYRKTQFIVVATLAALSAAAVAQTPKYAVTNVGTLTSNEIDHAVAVSSDGSKVVGYANYMSGTTYTRVTHNFLWDGTLHDVGPWSDTAPFVFGPIAVSNDGTVLLGPAYAHIWTRTGGMVQLVAPDGSNGVAYGINDSDVVAGRGRTTNLLGFDVNGNPLYAWTALKWSRDPVSGSWGSTSLDPLPGFNISGGYGGIDANGNIFGTSTYSDPTTGVTLANEATLWSPLDGYIPHDMGPAYADGRSGYPFGWSFDAATFSVRYAWNTQPNGWRGYYSDATGMSPLPIPDPNNPENYAAGVNSAGVVAGFAKYAGVRHAYCWSDGVQTDLGVPSEMTQNSAYVRPINDDGFIVGIWSQSRANVAFLSTPSSRANSTKVLDLNALLSNTLKSVTLKSLTNAVGINNAGYILCEGPSSGGGYTRVALLRRVQ